jgi:uncharacterized membrane protein YphA (DoxX/SURF4 family)
MNTDAKIRNAWQLIRYSFGAVIFLAGLDKVFGTNLITNWAGYISNEAMSVIGAANVPEFLFLAGVLEVAVGIMMLTYWPRLAGYAAAVWLVLISLNLFMGNYIDIAIRDILLAVSVYAGAELAAALGYSLWGKERIAWRTMRA